MGAASSDEVIKNLIRLQAGAESQPEVMIVGARLFLAMRRDMGNPTRLDERDFLRLLVQVKDWPQGILVGNQDPRSAGSCLERS
jgi:hypothetical protein